MAFVFIFVLALEPRAKHELPGQHLWAYVNEMHCSDSEISAHFVLRRILVTTEVFTAQQSACMDFTTSSHCLLVTADIIPVLQMRRLCSLKVLFSFTKSIENSSQPSVHVLPVSVV